MVRQPLLLPNKALIPTLITNTCKWFGTHLRGKLHRLSFEKVKACGFCCSPKEQFEPLLNDKQIAEWKLI